MIMIKLNILMALDGLKKWWDGLKMTIKMAWMGTLIAMALQVLVIIFLHTVFFNYDENISFGKLLFYRLASVVSPNHVFEFVINGKHYYHDIPYLVIGYSDFLKPIMLTAKIILGVSFLTWLLWPGIVGWFQSRAEERSDREYVRGARLVPEWELIRKLKKTSETVDIQVGRFVKMPWSAEVKHIFLCGRSGAGKTTLILQVIERLIARGEKIIIYDFKGEYLARFYDASRDLIFNPLDARGINWNIMKELKSIPDIERVATSLIPLSPGQDAVWDKAARSVFAACLLDLQRKGSRKNSDIWKAVSAPAVEIAQRLRAKGCEFGYRFVEEPNSKMAKSVLAGLMRYAHIFEYMGDDEIDFTLDSWLTNGTDGCIFVTSYTGVQDALRPVLSLFVDFFGHRFLNLQKGVNRRVFLFLDEFETLQKLGTIEGLVTHSGYQGGSVWLGIRDVGQIDTMYGEQNRKTIVNTCGTSALFGVADPETAEYLSRKIGETAYHEARRTRSRSGINNRVDLSLRDVIRHEILVFPSDLSRLPDFQFYLSFPGQQLVQTAIERKDIPNKAEPFVLRAGLSLDEILVKYRRIFGEAEEARRGVSTVPDKEKFIKKTGENKTEETENKEQGRNVPHSKDMDF